MHDRRQGFASVRIAVAIGVAACCIALAACAPSQPPHPPPSWVSTALRWDPAAGVERVLSATSESWWAVIETMPGLSGAATLQLYPRVGSDGAPAAAPSQSIPLGRVASDLAMSDHLLVVRMRNELAVLDEQRIFELDGEGTAGVWASAGLVPTAIDVQRAPNLDLTDDTLAVGRPGIPGSGLDGSVLIVPFDRSGPGITWSFATVQQLVPDPAWSVETRTGFGSQVALEGATLATTTGTDSVVTARRLGGAWSIDQVLVDPAGPGTGFGRSLSVDESSGAPRVLIGVQGKLDGFTPRPGRADLYQRGAGGWSFGRSISPRPGSFWGGFGLGYLVALDGDTAALGVHWLQPARPGGGGTVDDLRVELHRLSAPPSASLVGEVPLLTLAGGPTDDLTSVGPMTLDLVGSHLSITAQYDLDGPEFHLFAVSVDRHPGS